MRERHRDTALRMAAFGMLFAVLVVWTASVRAHVTIEIFVAWDQAAFENLPNSESGGLIRVNGDNQFTLPGVCGIEFHNVEAWHWSDAGGVMANLPSNGVALPGNAMLSYTGPYSGCDNNILMFTTRRAQAESFPKAHNGSSYKLMTCRISTISTSPTTRYPNRNGRKIMSGRACARCSRR